MRKKIPGCLILYESSNGDEKHRHYYLSEKAPAAAKAELQQYSAEGWKYRVLRVIRLSDLPNGSGEAEALSRLLAAILPNCGDQRDPWEAMVELIKLAAKAWNEGS